MIRILNKFLHIIKGWFYDFIDFNPELLKSRLEICNQCEHKKQLTKSIEICSECGCPLKKKCRVKEESCLLGKW